MTRIRYKTVDGVLVSKSMMVSGRNLMVKIDPQNTIFEIVDIDKNYVVACNTSTTLAKLKTVVKQTLKELGMAFDDEVRRRNSTESVDESNNDYVQEHQN